MTPRQYGAHLAVERPALTDEQVEQAARLFVQAEAAAMSATPPISRGPVDVKRAGSRGS